MKNDLDEVRLEHGKIHDIIFPPPFAEVRIESVQVKVRILFGKLEEGS